MAETRCVNDTNGDGDCAACARNPQAPCRQCVDCRQTGRCVEHPANGRLSLVDCAAEFREMYGDDAEDAALKLFLRPLPTHDWRFKVEYGPHPDGDPRNERVTFHAGAVATHVAVYLAREHITLGGPPTATDYDRWRRRWLDFQASVKGVGPMADLDREALGQVIRIAYLKAMGGGPELIAFVQSRDDDPETRERWHQIADAVLSHVEPPADPYAHLTGEERRQLANAARTMADRELDARNYTTGVIHPDGGQMLDERWHTRQERHDRWREIADGLHENQGVTDASR